MTLEDLVSALCSGISERAVRNGWGSGQDTALSAADVPAYPGEEIVGRPAAPQDASPLTRRALALAGGRITLLVVALPIDLDEAVDVLERSLWWAASVRSRMRPEHRFDRVQICH